MFDQQSAFFNKRDRALSRRGLMWGANCVLAIGLTACVVSDDEGATGEQAIADRIAEEIANVAPELEWAHRVSVHAEPSIIRTKGGTLDIAIPRHNIGWVKLGRVDHAGLRVGLPLAEREQAAVVAWDGTVTYQGGIASTDVAVQAFDHGVRIQTVMNDEAAPPEIEYPVYVPAGGEILEADDGSLMIVDGDGTFVGGLGAPWAKDSDSQDVATHYEVRDDIVVQIIEHHGKTVQYPVIADPWLWVDLIKSAAWETRDGGQTLKVTPTLWARSWGTSTASYLVGVAGWSELYSKYKNTGLDTNLGGMKDQYICHQQIGFWKSTWNLDEWRPDVSYAQTVLQLCNPDGGNWD